MPATQTWSRDGSDYPAGRFVEDAGAGAGTSSFGDVASYAICAGCGGFHSVFDTGGGGQGALNGDDRGGVGPNGKISLSTTDAASQLARGGLGWATPLGQPLTITYAFRTAAPTAAVSDTSGFTRFTQIQIDATLQALASWSDVANITFQRVSSTVAGDEGYSNDATILFGNYSAGADGAAAFAYLPGSRDINSFAGDVWINNTLAYNINPVQLGYGQQVLTHEIGHALGLRHPADYNAGAGVSITYANDATYYEDSRQYTVMSYFNESNTGGNFGSGRFSAAPLLDDIAAAQRLYGANMTTRTGDTVYGFNSNAGQAWYSAATGTSAVIFAVWDAGGIDTLDFSGYAQAQVIDLRQGAFSNAGALVGNVSIALGAVIENAVGGSGNDLLRGNSADNLLTGGAGNDTIDGGLGSDTVVFSGPRSAYTITWNGRIGTVVGPDGTETLTNVEFLRFSDQTIAAAPTGGIIVGGDVTSETINGSAFGDTLGGLGGNDAVNGLGGDDVLDGGSGNDLLSGGDGDDLLIGGLGNDSLDGGAGFDRADYAGAPGSVTVNLATGTATGAAGTDTLTGIEEVIGSTSNDTLTGDAGANVLRGNGGIDTLNGGGGNDTLVAGIGGVGGGAPDIVKPAATANGTIASAISINGGFDLQARGGVENATTIPHATVLGTGHGGVEYYAFTVQAGETVRFDIDNASFDAALRLFNGSGNELAQNDDASDTDTDGGASTDSLLTYTFPAAGTYYIQVSQWSATGTGEVFFSVPPPVGVTYQLNVSIPSAAVVPTILAGSTLNGEVGDDSLTGGDGADTLNGGVGNDALNGGSGVDTAVFAGNLATYTYSTVNGVTTITGADGTDTLTNVEQLRFADQTITLSGSNTGVNLIGTPGADDLLGSDQADSLSGGDGNDRLTGLSGNDVLSGGNGNDILNGGAGSDTLNGGDGFDVALYSGVRRQYGATITSVAGGPEGGTDTLSGIEELRFVDGILSFDVNGIAAQVMRLYDATLDRQPDQAGLDVQIRALATGATTLQGLADAFVASAEFQSRYGTLTNQQFVEQLYRFSLDREGDAPGIAVQVNALNTGTSRAALVVAFSESPEHRTLTQPILNNGLWVANDQALQVARLYDATFDRLPDAAGLAGQLAALAAGTSLLQLAANFAASAEFQARYGALSNQAFVEQLYRFCLNREGDAPGIAAQVSALNAGTSRAQLLLNFSESAEHVALTAPFFSGGIRTIDPPFSGAALETDAGKALDGQPQVLIGIDEDAGTPAMGEGKDGDHGPQVLIVEETASADVAQVLPTVVSYDLDDVAIDFKIIDDAFVLPPMDELEPLVLPDAEGLDAPARPTDGLAALTGDRMLTLPTAEDGTPDDVALWHRSHDDGWLLQ